MSQKSYSILEKSNPIGISALKSQASLKSRASSSVEEITSNLDKDGLWNIIFVLSITLIIMMLIVFGGAALLGGTVGETLNFLADTITVLGTKALQIFNGGVHEITSFVLPVKSTVEQVIPPSTPIMPVSMPVPISSSVPQNINNVEPSTAAVVTLKSDWCLLGEFNSRNSCVQIDDSRKCLSGQLFPTLDNCLVPLTK